MTDSQQHHKLAGLQPQGATTEDADSVDSRGETTDCPEINRESPEQAEATSPISQRPRSTIAGLVQEFDEAVGDFKQVLSPRGAGTPDKTATSSAFLGPSQTSPLCTDSWPTSPSLGVRVASSGKEHVSLVTEAVLETRIEQLTLAMHAHMVRAIREELTSFDSTLQGSFDALEARCEALEKKGGWHVQELERHEHNHRVLADRVDGLQRQSAEQDQRVAQSLEQLGQTGSQALDRLQLLGRRLDKMSQDHEESVGAQALVNQQMLVRLETREEQASMLHDSHKAHEQECKALQQQVKDISSQVAQVSEQDTCLARHVDTEMQRLEGMLHGPAPSVESDLQKIFQEFEDFKDKLHALNQVQIQDQNDFNEVDLFQKELGQRVNDEMKHLRDKVDEVADMVQEDLMGLHSKLCTDIENLHADRAVIVGEPPAPEEAADDDDSRWELQHRALEIETTASKALPEVTEAEQGARAPPSEQPPEHKEQPPKVICGDPPPLTGGSLTVRLESKRATVFPHTLPAEVTGGSEPPPLPQPAARGLAELQRMMDHKLDMSLRQVDEFITRHEAKLQQLGEVGNQYSAVQRQIGLVKGDLTVLKNDKVLSHMRSIQSLFGAGVPRGTDITCVSNQ
jgi:hypothetical protein